MLLLKSVQGSCWDQKWLRKFALRIRHQILTSCSALSPNVLIDLTSQWTIKAVFPCRFLKHVLYKLWKRYVLDHVFITRNKPEGWQLNWHQELHTHSSYLTFHKGGEQRKTWRVRIWHWSLQRQSLPCPAHFVRGMLISIHFPNSSNISLPDLVIPYQSVLKHARPSGSLEASHVLMAHLRGEACIFSMWLTQPKLWLHISKPLSVVNSFHTLECMQMASLYVKSNQKLNPWVRLLCMCGRLLQTSSILLVLSP